MIGHTQPRRLAARSIAARVADELGTEVGDLVGYSVRFTDEVSDRTLVKAMTDGILLAELQRDPDLRRYDTIIIDEAHERTLNIDFLLGYLRRLVERRDDLHLIITSATIDTEKFAAHFADAAGRPAPIIEVSGRTHPVEIRYQPLGDPDDPDAPVLDVPEGIERAARTLLRETPGDILCFLPGEREIREAQEHLTKKLGEVEIIPLYARLSPAEQQRIFQSHTGHRIVLSTNVAETSLTVPGIHAVIDTGTARISRSTDAPRCNACRSNPSPRPPPISVRAAAAGSARVWRFASTTNPASSTDPSSPNPKYSARTSPRSCCAWRHSASAMPSRFPSSIHPKLVRSATA